MRRLRLTVLIAGLAALAVACRSSRIATVKIWVPPGATLNQVTVVQLIYQADVSAILTKEVPFDLFRGAKTAVGPAATAGDRR